MLFSRFPGSKRNQAKYPIWDGSNFDAVIEPFAGGAAFSQAMLKRGVRSVFLADADPWVRAVYECWIDPNTHDAVYQSIRQLQLNFSDDPALGEQICKGVLDFHHQYSLPEVVAASLVLRHITFAGVVRVGAGKLLNVSLVEERLPTLLRWKFRFPPIQPGASISIADHWSKAVENLERWASDNPTKRAIALVDPPYYVPPMPQVHRQRKQSSAITPVYPGHKPHDPETLAMCVDAVRRLAAIPQVKFMAVTNYYSDELHQELLKIDPTITLTMGSKLDGLNCKRASTTQFVEATWTIGVRQTEQLRLAV